MIESLPSRSSSGFEEDVEYVRQGDRFWAWSSRMSQPNEMELDLGAPCLGQGSSQDPARGNDSQLKVSAMEVEVKSQPELSQSAASSSRGQTICKVFNSKRPEAHQHKHPWPFSEATHAEWQGRKLPRRNQSAPAASYEGSQEGVPTPFPGSGRILEAVAVQGQLDRLQTFQDFQTVSIGKERLSPRTRDRMARPATPRNNPLAILTPVGPSFAKTLENAAKALAERDERLERMEQQRREQEERFFEHVVDVSIGFRDGIAQGIAVDVPMPQSAEQPVLTGFVRAAKPEVPTLPRESQDDMEEVPEPTVEFGNNVLDSVRKALAGGGPGWKAGYP